MTASALVNCLEVLYRPPQFHSGFTEVHAMSTLDWTVEDHSDSPRTSLPKLWLTHCDGGPSFLDGAVEVNGRRLVVSLRLPEWARRLAPPKAA
jgi:hypothetical protein